MSLMKVVSFIAGLNLKENEISFEEVDRRRGNTEQIYHPSSELDFAIDFSKIQKTYNISELKI